MHSHIYLHDNTNAPEQKCTHIHYNLDTQLCTHMCACKYAKLDLICECMFGHRKAQMCTYTSTHVTTNIDAHKRNIHKHIQFHISILKHTLLM